MRKIQRFAQEIQNVHVITFLHKQMIGQYSEYVQFEQKTNYNKQKTFREQVCQLRARDEFIQTFIHETFFESSPRISHVTYSALSAQVSVVLGRPGVILEAHILGSYVCAKAQILGSY